MAHKNHTNIPENSEHQHSEVVSANTENTHTHTHSLHIYIIQINPESRRQNFLCTLATVSTLAQISLAQPDPHAPAKSHRSHRIIESLSKVKFIAQSCKTAVSSLALYCKPKPGEGSCSSYKQGPVDWSNHHRRYRKLAKFPFPLSPTASLRVVGRECHTPLLKKQFN